MILDNLSVNATILWLVVFIWLATITFLLFFAVRRYQQLTKGTNGRNLDKILRKIMSDQEKTKKSLDLNQKSVAALKKETRNYLQKKALVRYNPFNQTGGNQSFSLALLDGENSGIVISSFHSREGTRLYTKRVIKGKTDNSFSEEEKNAIKKAVK